MTAPTEKQLTLLRFIAERCAGGRPPSVREMCDQVRAKSPNTVFERLASLEERGLITRRGSYGTARSRYPTADGYRLADVAPTGRIKTYAAACEDLDLHPSPQLAERLVVVTSSGAWLLGDQLTEIP